MELTTFWFILLAVLWTGYFFLEGFDFGVGMLLHPLGRTETDRRVLVNSIGPVWDGNEVWLLTAGGAADADVRMFLARWADPDNTDPALSAKIDAAKAARADAQRALDEAEQELSAALTAERIEAEAAA